MANPTPCSSHFRPGSFRNRGPSAALAALILLFCPALQAATPAIGGDPAPAHEGTGPWITVNATNTQTSYNVVVYPGAITFNATLSDGKVGVPVDFSFTDASGGRPQTKTAVTAAGGVVGASFVPTAPGACTCEASANGYTPGSGSANSLQVEYFYNGQQIPNPLADLPVPAEWQAYVNVEVIPDSVPVILTTADPKLIIASSQSTTLVTDVSGQPRLTSANPSVGTSTDNVTLSGLPPLPIKVETVGVVADLNPPAFGNGVGEAVILNNLGDAQSPNPKVTDFAGDLFWQEPEALAGITGPITYGQVFWQEAGANQATKNEPGTPQGQWPGFPIASDGQNTATINCVSGNTKTTASYRFETSEQFLGFQQGPESAVAVVDTDVAPVPITSVTNATQAPLPITWAIGGSATVAWSSTTSEINALDHTTGANQSVTISGTLTIPDLVALGVNSATTDSSSVTTGVRRIDASSSSGQSTAALTTTIGPVAVPPGKTIYLLGVPDAYLHTDSATTVYPDANGDGVASGPGIPGSWHVWGKTAAMGFEVYEQ